MNFTATEYQTKYTQFQNGLMSQVEWERYAIAMLFAIMERERDVFIRLKFV